MFLVIVFSFLVFVIKIAFYNTQIDYFVFYSERLDKMWILSSEEFLQECVTNKTGKNAGKRSIWFNGNKKNPKTGQKEEYAKERYDKYLCTDFSRFH